MLFRHEYSFNHYCLARNCGCEKCGHRATPVSKSDEQVIASLPSFQVKTQQRQKVKLTLPSGILFPRKWLTSCVARIRSDGHGSPPGYDICDRSLLAGDCISSTGPIRSAAPPGDGYSKQLRQAIQTMTHASCTKRVMPSSKRDHGLVSVTIGHNAAA